MAKEVLGTEALGGVLIVDRFSAYNRAPCALQYCYAHLLRDVEDLQQEFPTDTELNHYALKVHRFLARLKVTPLLDYKLPRCKAAH